jgi:hypothetical protein
LLQASLRLLRGGRLPLFGYGVDMAEESKESAKGALIEKLTFAVLPLLFSCVVYLMSALSNLSHEVTILNSKISLVVTSDNKQASNTGAELARERLRQDLATEIQKNRDDIQYNRQKIAVIESKMGMK